MVRLVCREAGSRMATLTPADLRAFWAQSGGGGSAKSSQGGSSGGGRGAPLTMRAHYRALLQARRGPPTSSPPKPKGESADAKPVDAKQQQGTVKGPPAVAAVKTEGKDDVVPMDVAAKAASSVPPRDKSKDNFSGPATVKDEPANDALPASQVKVEAGGAAADAKTKDAIDTAAAATTAGDDKNSKDKTTNGNNPAPKADDKKGDSSTPADATMKEADGDAAKQQPKPMDVGDGKDATNGTKPSPGPATDAAAEGAKSPEGAKATDGNNDTGNGGDNDEDDDIDIGSFSELEEVALGMQLHQDIDELEHRLLAGDRPEASNGAQRRGSRRRLSLGQRLTLRCGRGRCCRPSATARKWRPQRQRQGDAPRAPPGAHLRWGTAARRSGHGRRRGAVRQQHALPGPQARGACRTVHPVVCAVGVVHVRGLVGLLTLWPYLFIH
eukprot:scaffold2645_cov378-Prasinococcus_capsulatus_cf.AAC.3